jgi:hypothetical protein
MKLRWSALGLVFLLFVRAAFGAPALGDLEGRVQSADRKPVRGASVRLDTGQSAVTDSSGHFQITDIPAGPHKVAIEARGYRPAGGEVTVEAGATRSLLVETRPLEGARKTASPAATGTLRVHAYTKTYGGKRAWVSKIEVWEQGDRNHRWTQTWYSDTGDTYRALSCPKATIGRTYKVAIIWRHGSSSRYGTWLRTLRRSGQTESFYQP